MITNIIKNIIKDIPSVATSTIKLVYANKEHNEFTVAPVTDDKLIIVVQSTPGAASSAEDWKKKMIADTLYMATQADCYDANHNILTMSVLADTIDDIINTKVVLWQL